VLKFPAIAPSRKKRRRKSSATIGRYAESKPCQRGLSEGVRLLATIAAHPDETGVSFSSWNLDFGNDQYV
jgi:hypothetical protein